MMLVNFRKELYGILEELERLEEASEIDEELFTPIRTMLEILEAFKENEQKNKKNRNRRKDKFLEGGYELISGHRRKHASELAGKDTMPVIVRDCDNDEAVVIMVDANIQREDILVSERAKAYQMKYEAMKHQGKAQGNSLQEMSEQVGESMKTIQRLICIASLDEKLLAMVDEKKLGLRQGVDLSFIPQEQQRIVYEVISEMGVSLSQEQSARIKEASRKGYLNADFLRDFLSEKKPKPRKVVFNQKKLDNYFTPDMSNEDIEELIVKLLDEWKEKGEPR